MLWSLHLILSSSPPSKLSSIHLSCPCCTQVASLCSCHLHPPSRLQVQNTAFEFVECKTHLEIFWFLPDQGQISCAVDVEKWELIHPCHMQQKSADTRNCRASCHFPFAYFSFFHTVETLFQGDTILQEFSLMSCISQLGKFLLYSCDNII